MEQPTYQLIFLYCGKEVVQREGVRPLMYWMRNKLANEPQYKPGKLIIKPKCQNSTLPNHATTGSVQCTHANSLVSMKQ